MVLARVRSLFAAGLFVAGLFAAWTLLFSASLAKAQFIERIPPGAKSLSPASQATIASLGSLGQLPADEWRYHAGDIEHGESLSLDDNAWQVVKARSDAPTDAVWYRRTISVPKTLNGYDLTGTRIWFSFTATANGPMPEIIYFNGRRVALGDDLEPIVLFDNARAGDKVLVAVKLLHTVDKKTFRGVQMRIDFAANRPNPEDLRTQFLSTALLLPSLSTNPAKDQMALESALSAVDLNALKSENQQAFDASLKTAQSKLETLKPVIQQATAHLTGNSHIDAAWLWPWSETVDVVKRTFGTALQLMNEYPRYTYTQSAAAYNEWIAEKYPEMNDQIRQRIKEGRWEIVGGMWLEPDLNMPDGESLVRQILLGKRFYKQQYGVDVRIGWNPDSFGYNWQLPQIYKKSGMDYFVTQKMTWNDTNKLPFKLFWWQSPDGSKVLAYFPHDYANGDLSPLRLSEDIATARQQSPGLLEMMDLYGVGDHGGGPTRAILDEGVHWMQPDQVVPHTEFGLAQTYFTSVEKKINPDSPVWNYTTIAQGNTQLPPPATGMISIPTWKDEMYFEYHRGVMTTQANHKRNMRESEEWVLNAEKYSSLAWLAGAQYPQAQLTEAWKKVLFNQFHDLAAGSGIGVIYKDAQRDYDQVRWATNEASANALKTLASEIDTRVSDGVPVLVFNPLAWPRSGIVTVDAQLPSTTTTVSVLDSQGRVLPSEILSHDANTNTYHLLLKAENVPSLGYEILRVVPGSRPFPSDLKSDGLTLENDALKLSVDPHTGCITSLYDKKTHFETLAPAACGNQLIAFKDTPKDYDAWNIDANFEDNPTLLDKADSVQLIEHTPFRAVIRVTRVWQNSKFIQDIVLTTGADQVDIVNDIDWHETHVLLKAAFPLAASSENATYEIPYGTIQRPTTRNNSWEQAKFEVPAMRWADLGNTKNGFSLINESKYGYDAKGNVLRLSLLRSPTWPDPEADRGHHHFSYSLYPHGGTWQQALTVRHGYEYNYKLTAQQVLAHTGSLPATHSYVVVDSDGVVLTAVKKSEDGNALIFRLYDWSGKDGSGKDSTVSLTLPPGATAAVLTNLMEQPDGKPLELRSGHVAVPVHPYEIVTIRADYPKGAASLPQ